ncbi:MAG TPA: hypothetical protein VKT70_10035 [Stellaceae bacterium]|nr:hypothetical protein [Stellaceae bacterium]
MFALSFGKLLLLAILVAILWYGYKYLHRIDEVRRLLRQEMTRRQREAGTKRASLAAEDLILCLRCGAYVSPKSDPCGRPACPQGSRP